MNTDEKIELIKEFAKEIVTEEELRALFDKGVALVAYDGFEPSGLAPIHFGLLRATNLKKMLQVGIKFKLYLADYFAMINNKLGGDLKDIHLAGEYFIEVWKACGIDISKVEVIWANEIMDDLKYWDKTLRIAKEISLERNMRATTIMGRKQGEKLSMAQLFYPPMQITDVFHLGVDICQMGMDQRRANILAREIADKLRWKKPVAIHHPMLLGLQGIQKRENDEETMIASKMSKSDPKSCIYMHDSYEELKKKINKAFCPEKEEYGNPILDYCKNIIFRETNLVVINRPEKYGGQIEYKSYEELRKDYIEGNLSSVDLKAGVLEELNRLIKPVREHFEKDSKAKILYEKVKNLVITR